MTDIAYCHCSFVEHTAELLGIEGAVVIGVELGELLRGACLGPKGSIVPSLSGSSASVIAATTALSEIAT